MTWADSFGDDDVHWHGFRKCSSPSGEATTSHIEDTSCGPDPQRYIEYHRQNYAVGEGTDISVLLR
jgi:hypothetical protein